MNSFDALLIVGVGGPEKHEDVLPCLENVLRGKNVPRERRLEVAEHYYHFDGRSPINEQTKELITAVEQEFRDHGVKMPVYWGNRNWYPFLADTLKQMQADGIRHAAALVTSAFGSYSGCRQYREDIACEQHAAGVRSVIICPIGFISDHMEVLYDLDTEARALCDQLGMKMVRTGTAGGRFKQ